MKDKHKVSDLKQEYLINFLQEYSYYVKEYRDNKLFNNHLMCPSEFFQDQYIDILHETDKYFDAFIEPEEIEEIKKFVDMCSLYYYVGELEIGDDEFINRLEDLAQNNQHDAIITLVKKDNQKLKASELFYYHFNMKLQELNELADEAGFERI